MKFDGGVSCMKLCKNVQRLSFQAELSLKWQHKGTEIKILKQKKKIRKSLQKCCNYIPGGHNWHHLMVLNSAFVI